FAPTDGSRGERAIRTAQYQNPNQSIDAPPIVSKPGDRYPTADAAAIDALIAVDGLTRSTKLEYAGRIYQKVDGSFSYTRGLNDSQRDPSIPNRNCCPDFSTPGEVPKGTVSMGSYHTHPYARGTTNAEFSMIDLSFYTYKDYFLAMCSGPT